MSHNLTYRRHAPEVRMWRAAMTPDRAGEGLRGLARVNLRRTIVHHSPDGYEWGYNGSGPADLALEIMHRCLPPGCDRQEPERCFRGQCSQIAYRLHQGFKRSVIAAVCEQGGTISGVLIDAWIDGALSELARQGFFSGEGAPALPIYFSETLTAK